MSPVVHASVAILITLLATWVFYRDQFPLRDPKELQETYDFVIIGGGSAGSVLANRLSEDEGRSILVLEAGGLPSTLSYYQIPGLAIPNTIDTAIDWKFKTVPQEKACLGLNNQESKWPRGKALGGTGSIYYMVHHRGSPGDYDRWAAEGATGWSYADLLPYFKKLESVAFPGADAELRGKNGPVTCIRTSVDTTLGRHFLKGAIEQGFELIDDYNGKKQEGFGYFQMSIKNGRRNGPFSAYLEAAKNRQNLHIVSEAHVTKILFSEEKRANAVEYLHKGKKFRIQAKKEIILSAGAIGSPQLLMLSGIGPKEHLTSLGIPVLVDSPQVGQNLQDHIKSFIYFKLNQSLGMDFQPFWSLGSVKNAIQYFAFGTGPWSRSRHEIQGLVRSGVGPDPNEVPDMQLFFSALSSNSKLGWSLNLNDSKESAEEGENRFQLISSCQRPKSRGEVQLRSSNPLDPPLIHPRYLQDERDLKVVVKGFQVLLEIMKTKSMQSLGAEVAEGRIPGCQTHQFLSDDYLSCLVRHRTLTIWHPTSTCRMGSQNAVLDTRLRVGGVEGLRVVDASVFPDIPGGNTHIPVLAVAEKAADLVKIDHPLS